MSSSRIFEFVLGAILVHLILWIVFSEFGPYLSMGLSLLTFIIVCLAHLAELIQKSKVPRIYFQAMWILVVSGLLVGALMLILKL